MGEDSGSEGETDEGGDAADDETERLRDIFVETTGAETVTEEQQADRGSLLGRPDVDRLVDIVAEMRAELGFETDLDDEQLATVVREFYDGAEDGTIAEAVGVDPATARRARLDLHLLREGDADTEVLAAVRTGDVPGDADPAAVERARAVARVQERTRRTSERFRTAFEELLTDADLEGRVVGDARADGLREAAADIEPDADLDF